MHPPFPGKLLHRKVRKDGAVIEVRTRHTLWPKIPSYWEKVSAITLKIGNTMGLPGYVGEGIDVMAIANKADRLRNGIGDTPVSDSPTSGE